MLMTVNRILCLVFFCLAPLSALGADAPLADAAEKGDWQRVRTILKENPAAGAAAQPDGMTALHWAAYHDEPEVAKLLLAAGVSAKVESRYGVTPLSLACTNGDADLVR